MGEERTLDMQLGSVLGVCRPERVVEEEEGDRLSLESTEPRDRCDDLRESEVSGPQSRGELSAGLREGEKGEWWLGRKQDMGGLPFQG